MGRVATILVSVSTFPFSSRGTRLMIHSSSFFRHSSTMARYWVICSSFALYSRWIYSTISWELLLISNLVMTNIRARSSLASTTSYFASLLEDEKLIWIACSINSSVDDYRTIPTPDPNTLDASSTWSVHHYALGWLTGCVCFLGSSVLKLAITCPFKDNRNWYLIPYSLNSITHFNIHPDRFDLCKVTQSDWL